MHTPYLHDRFLALENAQYVMNTAKSIDQCFTIRKEGPLAKRAQKVLRDTEVFLEEIAELGLMETIAQGRFADIKRRVEGGKGLSGVVQKGKNYFNPFVEALAKRVGKEEEVPRWM